ncbi:type II toxin-antitoxin system RelE/ParE family toxin [Dyadobacter jiangsuensis]|uniref:Proteic killer suppression protein n=1 Tax=Dyadobacter jiangsuensis TaxID=1591085 RepID=A0A2P8FVF9_9BACT|nr:killer suppression protein HigA [Dyadobacter jiangsuensis]PSL25710.1 proteic killer suppression protein [Dyadobacter jiangsuensis]
MEISYANNKIKKQLSNASEIQKAFGVNAKKVAARLDDILAAPNLAVLITIPAANCHPLKGKRQGEWAVNISPNHRLIFEIGNSPIPKTNDNSVNTILVTEIVIVETVDYH